MQTSFARFFAAIAVFAILAVVTGCSRTVSATSGNAQAQVRSSVGSRGALTRPVAAGLIKQSARSLKQAVRLTFQSGPQYRSRALDLLCAYGAIDYKVITDTIIDVSYTEKTMANLGSHRWGGPRVRENHIESNSMGTVLMDGGGPEVQSAEIPLATAEFVEVTGILSETGQATAEWTWRWVTSQSFQEITSIPGYSGDLAGQIQSGVFKEKTAFVLYDDGWRLR